MMPKSSKSDHTPTLRQIRKANAAKMAARLLKLEQKEQLAQQASAEA